MTSTELFVIAALTATGYLTLRGIAFAVRWLSDQHRYRLPKPPPVPRWREIDAADVVEAWDRHYAETSG